jgi:hypothetical protein
MRRWNETFTVSLLAGLTLLVWACGAGDGVESATTDATLADTAPAGGEEPETEPAGAEEPDNCSLITPDEATALAGYELEVGEDSILGCGYFPPRSVTRGTASSSSRPGLEASGMTSSRSGVSPRRLISSSMMTAGAPSPSR